MKDIVIATEITSIIFLLIFLFSIIVEDKQKNLKKHIFVIILICWIIALVIDSVSWIIVTNPNMTFQLQMFTMASFFMGGIETTAGAYYILAHVNTLEIKSFWYAHVIAIINVSAIIIAIGLTIQGKTYSIESGEFINTPMYVYVGVVVTISLLYLIGFSIHNRKILGAHDTIGFVIYLTIPLIATLIQCIWNELAFSYVASSISAAILFVMLQSKEINEGRMREEILNRVSNLDPLTGLNNRRAYDAVLSKLEANVRMGVIFCDLNGLKYTNDHLGHTEGDKLICIFASIMKKHFRKEDIYRVSGDEFVILLSKLTEEMFDERVEEFRKTLMVHEQIAAIGAAFGQSNSALELISEAENGMYADKNYYYYHTGKERRKR